MGSHEAAKMIMSKVPWIGTNWKMNKRRAEARAFAAALAASPHSRSGDARLFIIPSFPYVADVAEILSGTRVMVGVQNMHWEEEGAWTGEISPLMVRDCGAHLAEIGHSERRMHFGETDETVALKVRAALKHGLVALVCIGDTRAQYEAGQTSEILARQTRMALDQVGREARDRIVLAYEPVWSIGERGIPADPDFADEQHERIKLVAEDATGASLPVLYGGSVNLQNCDAFASRPYIDGLFIGRSAWEAAGYLGIVESVLSTLRRTS
jgi:L-erythrulose 1-phosphate isomerase